MRIPEMEPQDRRPFGLKVGNISGYQPRRTHKSELDSRASCYVSMVKTRRARQGRVRGKDVAGDPKHLGPKGHVNIRILETMVAGILRILGLTTTA